MNRAKTTLTYALLLISILMTGCKADRLKAIQLISPLSSDKVEPSGTTFSWKTKDDDPVRFVLGTKGFATTLFDTTLTGDAVTYREALEPCSTYSWQVEQGEHVSASTFQVADIAARFEGHYTGTMTEWGWSGGTPFPDSTYAAEIDLEKIDDLMKVSGAQDLMLRYSYNSSKTTVIYDVPGSSSYAHSLALNYVNDSIRLYSSSGGQSGRHYWLFRAAR